MAIPAETGVPAEFRVIGDVVSVETPGGAPVDVRFGRIAMASFSDLDVDVDEAAVRFSSDGVETSEWPTPGALLGAIPADLRGGGGVAAEGAAGARGRVGAGRGRGVPPAVGAVPGPGAGRGRVTLSSLAGQVSNVLSSLHGVREDVASLTVRMSEVETGAGGPLGRDLFGPVEDPVDDAQLRAEVAGRRAGGPSLGAVASPPGVERPPPGLAADGGGAGGRGGGPPHRERDPVVEAPGAGRVRSAPGRPPERALLPEAAEDGSAGPNGAVSGNVVADLLREQTSVLKRMRMGDADLDDPDDHELRLPGAKGAAAMDGLMRKKQTRPSYFTDIVEASLKRMAAQQPGASESPAASAKAYVGFSIPFMSTFGPQRTLGYLGWGVATAWDALHTGDVEGALGTLSLLLVAVEQAALDDGAWSLAWLLSLLPDPPWATMLRRPDAHALRPYAKLADTRWVSASLSFLRDVERIKTVRREVQPHQPAPKSQPWQPQAPPSAEVKPEEPGGGGPKGRGKTKTKSPKGGLGPPP